MVHGVRLIDEKPTQVRPLTPPASFLVRARELGIAFDDGDLVRLGAYLALLLDTNTRTNLTAIKDPDEAWTRHILDALTLLPIIAATDNPEPRIIDVGTGGGVPGIPLAIVMPGARVALLEATGKKAAFLLETVHTLGLANVLVHHERAERFGHKKDQRESFDVVTARALGPLNVLCEFCVPLARPGGVVLAIKGQRADEELQDARHALGILGAKHLDTHQTPTGRVVVLEKTTRTPRPYPRKDGEPKKHPLSRA